ncbi:MAG: CBS domain-containing protein [Gemmatimonadota bacterium]
MGLTVGDLCNREVVRTAEHESIRQAARRMRKHHVGDLVVVDDREVPIGILTDRDLVVGPLAEGRDVDALTASEVMSRSLVVAAEEEGLDEALHRMRSKAVRRLPVVNSEGDLVGILTVDDVLGVLNEELSKVVRLVMREQLRETADRRPV